jgi:hypothetical protein
MIDPGLGHMGGAGAGASGSMSVDIADQSAPRPGNSNDLPSR